MLFTERNIKFFALPVYELTKNDHNHNFFEFSFVRKGQNTNVINGNKIPFSRGTCVLLRLQDHHYFDNIMPTDPSKYEHIDVYVNKEEFKLCCDTIGPTIYDEINNQIEPVVFNLSSAFLETINCKIDFLINNQSSDFAPSIHKIIVIELLGAYLEDKNLVNHNYPEWLNKLLIDLNSLDTIKSKIKDISDKYGYTPEHLSREFSKHTGVKLMDYITNQKIKYSLPLILENKLQIIDIALILGYHKQSTFSSNFKSIMKCTPKQYQLKNIKKQQSKDNKNTP